MAKRRFTKRRPVRRTFKKRSFKKRTFKKQTVRRLRKPVSRGTMGSTVETIAFQDLGTSSGIPVGFKFQISQFPRAFALQANFKYYRPVSVLWTYEALYNTWPSVTGATNTTPVFQPGPTVPQLYTVMDRLGQFPYISLSQVQDAGVRPRPLSRKQIVKYVPNRVGVNIDPQSSTATPGTDPVNSLFSKSAPWSATFQSDAGTPNDHFWLGHQAIIDQANTTAAGPATLTRVTCTVRWQFKDPYIDNELEEELRKELKYITPKKA